MDMVQFRISRNYGFVLDLLRSAIPPIRHTRLGDTMTIMNTVTHDIESRTYIDTDNARYSSFGLVRHD